jgi:uncharacterized protein YndB with AHSA1/START domain
MRPIEKRVAGAACRGDVWRAWTTATGAQTFFAPAARVDLRIGGRYEMLFDLEAPEGERGSEGCRVLSYLPEEMLSVEWNAPPEYPSLRAAHTWLVVQLRELAPANTEVRLTHLGWGEGGEWEQVRAYFERAWDLVLARLAYRFAHGPLDWDDPYRPESSGGT